MGGDIFIRGVRSVDPASGSDLVRDLFIHRGRFAAPPAEPPADALVVDGAGLVAAPGFTDLHVHLREPGREEAETIDTGTQAAAAGGFTRVVAMPNTTPPMDRPEVLDFVRRQAEAADHADVMPSACLTRDRAGQAVSDMEALADSGAACFTDDGTTVMDDGVMREAMRRAMKLGLVAMDHAQDHEAEKAGVMHEGDRSRRWGLPGIPSAAETRIIERDIRLARETGGALHIQHISSAEGAELVRLARREGLRVTAEATPHHLALCDEDIDPANADYKMNPPLRAARDRAALADAIADGTITCLATDHAPHAKAQKDLGFLKAPFGVVGLETAIGVTHDVLVRTGRIDLLRWVRLWTSGPCAVLGLAAPTLADGARADLVLLDLRTPWTVDASGFRTKSHNSPFAGRRLSARAVMTIRKGRVAWSR